MRSKPVLFAFALSAGALGASLAPAAENAPVRLAQLFNRPQPPADVMDEDSPRRPSMDASALVVRIDRLEGQVRDLTGQIEQLQFQLRRLQEQGRAPGQTGMAAPAVPPVAAAVPSQPPTVAPLGAPVTLGAAAPGPVGDRGRLRRGDAFDPAADPAAPGAPKPLGTTMPSAPLSGPLSREAREESRQEPPASMRPMDLGAPTQASPTPGPAAVGDVKIAEAHAPGPKEQYELAAAFLKQGQFDAAEKGFSTFIQKNPRSRYMPDAIFGLGESYFDRGRHREAAEQYLKISTHYANSSKGPDAMLRLGQALHALGAKEQACASFTEVGRKYPSASTAIRAAEREAKKIQC